MGAKSKALLCRWLRPHHFVVLFLFCIISALVSAYTIAVAEKFVNPLFPYISDAGTKSPASCVFGMFLNLSALLSFFLMYIWHGLFEQYSCLDNSRLHTINDVGCLMGTLSAVGIMLVANFQVSNVLTIHMIGAAMTFLLGVVYTWIVSYLSKNSIISGFATQSKTMVRVVLAGLSTVFFTTTFIPVPLANNPFSHEKNSTMTDEERYHWHSWQPGYSAHLVSTFSEWLMVISFTFFFATYYSDFKHVDTSVRIVSVNSAEQTTFRDSSSGTMA